MNSRLTIFVLAALLAMPAAAAKETPRWEPAGGPLAHGMAHAPDERLHERLLPKFELDWRRERERLADMVCGLGLIALALVECDWTAAVLAPANDILVLPPPPPAPSYTGDSLEYREPGELGRRSIEARMQSI